MWKKTGPVQRKRNEVKGGGEKDSCIVQVDFLMKWSEHKNGYMVQKIITNSLGFSYEVSLYTSLLSQA